MNFKIIALIIIAIVFLYRLFLNILHAKSAGNPIPENVADITKSQMARDYDDAVAHMDARISVGYDDPAAAADAGDQDVGLDFEF